MNPSLKSSRDPGLVGFECQLLAWVAWLKGSLGCGWCHGVMRLEALQHRHSWRLHSGLALTNCGALDSTSSRKAEIYQRGAEVSGAFEVGVANLGARFWRMNNDFLFSFERIWWMYIDSMILMGSSIFQTDRGSPKFADTSLWGTHLHCCHLCCCEKVGQPTFEQSWRRPDSSKASETTATRGLGVAKGWKEWTQGCYSYGAACLPFCYVILPAYHACMALFTPEINQR